MADALNKDITDGSATPEPRESGGKKKKKKKRGCGFFILSLLLAVGIAAGIQASGTVDLRPVVYPIVPRLPVIGPQMAELLSVPEEYSLTAAERRKLELEEWEREIARSARSLDQREAQLREASADLGVRLAEVEDTQRELAVRLEALSSDVGSDGTASLSPAQQSEIRDIVRTFEEMSPKNAAAIIEKLNRNLAVSVLDGLPEDFRAKALGRMEAAVAAELMEQLTELQKKRGN